MKIADAKKAAEPAIDLPLLKVFPIFVPTRAAKQSEIIRINQEQIARFLGNRRAVKKKPSIIKLEPLNANEPLLSSFLIIFAKNLATNSLIFILRCRDMSKYKVAAVITKSIMVIVVLEINKYNKGNIIADRWKTLRFLSKSKSSMFMRLLKLNKAYLTNLTITNILRLVFY